jgi:hypothetical protein
MPVALLGQRRALHGLPRTFPCSAESTVADGLFDRGKAVYDCEKQKENANRATLAVARKMVAYLVAVDRRQKDFLVTTAERRERELKTLKSSAYALLLSASGELLPS